MHMKNRKKQKHMKMSKNKILEHEVNLEII